MRETDLAMEKYGLSRYEYRQLKYLCLDYHNMVQRLKHMRSIQGIYEEMAKPMDGMPRGGGPGDPTVGVSDGRAFPKG